MRRVKGCLNENCPEYQKTKYKEADEYCVKCGSELGYICKQKGCYKPIPDDKHMAYCPTHEGARKDRADRAKDTAVKIGGMAVAVGVFAVTTGKELVVSFVKKK